MDPLLARLEALEKHVALQDAEISMQKNAIAALERGTSKYEKHYQRQVEEILQGQHLYIPGVGQTDVTTDEQHAEIKRWSRYHEVIGQLTKYQQGAPRKKLSVYFFGTKPNAARVRDIERSMENHKIHMFSFGEDDVLHDHSKAADQVLKDVVDMWLDANTVKASGKRVHLHRFTKAFAKHVRNVEMRGIGDKAFQKRLDRMGYVVTPSGNAGKQRDTSCCDGVSRCVIGADVLNWNASLYGKYSCRD